MKNILMNEAINQWMSERIEMNKQMVYQMDE